ncbi:MAG: GNAT family N-acetyltransferase [Oscillospiraceae bacterium]|nr:GNAT family N-acetyltransferase [Oscillospiraceae bacterium]
MNASVDLSDVRLETDRLILREWQETDLEDFYEYARVDGVGQMAGWQPHDTIETSKIVLDIFMSGKKTFAVQLKENNKVIGSVGIEELSMVPGAEYESLYGRELGYVLNKDYWGKGIMPEAVKKVIEYCFENCGCDYLICSCSPANSQSKRVIEKCGFEFLTEKVRKLSDGTERTALYHTLHK